MAKTSEALIKVKSYSTLLTEHRLFSKIIFYLLSIMKLSNGCDMVTY